MKTYKSGAAAMDAYVAGDLDEPYADFIMEHGDPSERVICNGDTLLEAMEEGYLLNEFIATIVEK